MYLIILHPGYFEAMILSLPFADGVFFLQGSGNVLGITVMYVANLLPHFATSAPTHSVRNTKMGLLSALPRMGNPTAVSMT